MLDARQLKSHSLLLLIKDHLEPLFIPQQTIPNTTPPETTRETDPDTKMDQDTNKSEDHTHTTEQTTEQDPSAKLMESTSKLVSTLLDIKKFKPTVDFMEQLALGNRLCCSNLQRDFCGCV